MSIVIREIIVKTTVEPEKVPEKEWVIPSEMLEQWKEEIWKAIEWKEQAAAKRKER